MPAGGKREGSGRKTLFKQRKVITLAIEKSVLDSIPGNKQEFIRDAVLYLLLKYGIKI